MIRLLQIFLTVVLTSLFFFPFELTVLPGINSKMIMAVVGLAFCVAELVKRQSFTIPKELLSLLFFASAGSLFSLLSITLNQTPDTTYVSFIISFCVWLSAAFVVCCCIRWTHGRMDVQLVLDYLIAVCLIQCILALVINNKPLMAQWINTHTYFGQDVAIKTKRLYGIGALLDVAGLRMAAVLSGIAFYLSEVKVPLSPVRRNRSGRSCNFAWPVFKAVPPGFGRKAPGTFLMGTDIGDRHCHLRSAVQHQSAGA